jgi:anti-sigma factor RsiW
MTDSRTCRELEPALTPYVDGESSPPERAAVDAHLNRCPPCRDRVAGERAVRDALHARRDRLRPAASDLLRARCAAHARSTAASPAVSRRPRFWRVRGIPPSRLVPLSLAATLLLAVAGIFLFGVNEEAIAAQLTLDHMKCFDVIGEEGTQDPKAAEAKWLAERGWSIGVAPSSTEHGLQLVGIRRCLSTDGTAAHCMYRWRDEDLSVYILPHALDSVGTAEQAIEKLGHRAIMWTSGGRTYVVLVRARLRQGSGGQGRHEGLDAVAGYIRRQVR